MGMSLKRLFAVLLCMAMLVTVCACGKTGPTESSSTETTSGETTSGETTGQTELPLDEIKNAIKIEASPVTQTTEIPLLVILANFDANGNGVNDWDENDPDKLYSDKTKDYYGEQWAGSTLTEQY